MVLIHNFLMPEWKNLQYVSTVLHWITWVRAKLFPSPFLCRLLFCLDFQHVSCLYFLHSKVKSTGSGACLSPPVPEFQHTRSSENWCEKRRRGAWRPAGVSHNEHQFAHHDRFIKFLSGAKLTSQQTNDARQKSWFRWL